MDYIRPRDKITIYRCYQVLLSDWCDEQSRTDPSNSCWKKVIDFKSIFVKNLFLQTQRHIKRLHNIVQV